MNTGPVPVLARLAWYCIEGIEMRQLAFRSADVYCQNLNNLNAHSHYFYMQTERRGNRQIVRETKKDNVRECERCRKMDIGIHHKTYHWKNPLTSFWDKLGRINFFWDDDNWYDDMSHILHTGTGTKTSTLVKSQRFHCSCKSDYEKRFKTLIPG